MASFGSGGAASVETVLNRVTGMALLANGDPVLLGTSPIDGSSSTVVVLDATTGQPASGFGAAGAFSDGSNSGNALDVAVDDSGRVLFTAQGAGGPEVLRLLANGTLDASWGTTGRAALPGFDAIEVPHVAAAPGGKAIVAGVGSFGVLQVVRLSSAGAVEATYTSVMKDLQNAVVGRVALAADGSVFVSGWAYTKPPVAFVAKLTPALALDASFGGKGIVKEPQSVPPVRHRGVTGPVVVPLPSGGALFAASDVAALHEITHVIRYTAAGTHDTTYATNGLGTLVDLAVLDLRPQPDGRVLASGRVWTSTTGIDAWAARLLP